MLGLLVALASAADWAVLFVGSRTYSNYRHQANVFTAYKLLVDRGFDKSKIIVCDYDDVPQSSSNPFKGQLFHSLEHVNVYDHDAIKYTTRQINADLFYDVCAGRKALKSTSNDNVYVYYDNHGGPDILGVPEGAGRYIYGGKLYKAFKELSEKNMFNKLFFMIGACYSGSIGQYFDIPNMAVITSANAHQSAYACCYDSSVGAYLTNEFSINFDTIIRNTPGITVGQFFTQLKAKVKSSEICFFGDDSLKTTKMSEFVGRREEGLAPREEVIYNDAATPRQAAIRSMRVRAQSAQMRAQMYQDLAQKFSSHSKTTALFDKLSKALPAAEAVKRVDETCYEAAIEYMNAKCGVVDEDDMGYLGKFAQYCAASNIETIKEKIDLAC